MGFGSGGCGCNFGIVPGLDSEGGPSAGREWFFRGTIVRPLPPALASKEMRSLGRYVAMPNRPPQATACVLTHFLTPAYTLSDQLGHIDRLQRALHELLLHLHTIRFAIYAILVLGGGCVLDGGLQDGFGGTVCGLAGLGFGTQQFVGI